jgi:hypothetical protein
MISHFMPPSPWTEKKIEGLVLELDYLCANRWIHFDPNDPVSSLRKLLEWEVQTALDPAVSKAARDLIERGRQEQLKDIFGDK